MSKPIAFTTNYCIYFCDGSVKHKYINLFHQWKWNQKRKLVYIKWSKSERFGKASKDVQEAYLNYLASLINTPEI